MIGFQKFVDLKENIESEAPSSELELKSSAEKIAEMFGGSSNTDFRPNQHGVITIQIKNRLGGATAVYFSMGPNGVEADTMHFTKQLINGAYVTGDFASARDWISHMKLSGYDVSKGKFRLSMNMQELEDHLFRHV
jgi:hypothetical protein